MNHPLIKLQAEYRKKILANGFKLIVVSEEEAEDGIGFPGNNYMKNGYGYMFEDALEEIGEYENYRSGRTEIFEQRRQRRQQRMANVDMSGYISPDTDM